jgi:hypothetical protein
LGRTQNVERRNDVMTPPRIRLFLRVAGCSLLMLLLGWGCPLALERLLRPHVPLSLNPRIFTGYYYYWGSDHRGGRQFYEVVANEGICGHWTVDINGPGWSRYRGYYPDGTLREEGKIYVSYGDFPPEPQPDQHNLRWGKYYRPDGTLGGEIRDGTGEQLLWYPDGKLRWKLVLKDYKRVMYELWLEDGTLLSSKGYDSNGSEVDISDSAEGEQKRKERTGTILDEGRQEEQ